MINTWRRGFEAAKAARQHAIAGQDSKKLGAALFSGSILVSFGANKYGYSHPLSRGYNFDRGIHAEHSALIKRQHYDQGSNLIMYVYRETKDGREACSRPCRLCAWLMKEAGVKRVRFFGESGEPEEIRL